MADKPKEAEVKETPEEGKAEGATVGKLKPGDIFVYKDDRYKVDKRGGKNVEVILLTQVQVGATATTEKTIEYGIERLELPVGTQVVKSKPLAN